MSSPTICVLGSVNMDLVVGTENMPRPGQTLMGTGFRTVPGGKGANQAIAAARAGGQVRFLGAVGSDEFGGTLRRNLADRGVDAALLREVDGPSGIAVITVDARGENTIIVVAGANDTVQTLTDAERGAIGTAALVICQLEIPLETVTAGAVEAAAAGVTFLLNPSPMQELPAALLEATTVLVVNEGEADELGVAADTVPHLITTLGGAGARYRGPDGSTIAVHAPAVTVVDTTGAGDAFTGALAVAWTEGAPITEVLRRACAAGGLATTRAGAYSPSREETLALALQTYGQSD